MRDTMTLDAESSEQKRNSAPARRPRYGSVEYATAERLYDGDSYLIACELGVTVQVVEDYKSLLASRVTTAYGERTVE